MVFWILAIAMTALASAALYYASARQPVNAAASAGDASAVDAHLRLQFREIEADARSGRLGEEEARAARAELAREVLRLEAEVPPTAGPIRAGRSVVALSLAGAAVLAFAVYAGIGSPQMPAQPLAERPALPGQMTMEQAVARIEQELLRNPDDIRGWRAVAPAYMQLSRPQDAANAYRRILALAPPTADIETNLAEALMVAQNGSLQGEPLALLESAAARDPTHVRSRYYLAGAATSAGNFDEAIGRWQGLIDMATGEEAWLPMARQGLEAAMTARDGMGAGPEDVRARVADLAARLAEQGGSEEEWAQLVRSYLVLGDRDAAQAAYRDALVDHPAAAERFILDTLAADNGLIAAEPAR
jgi:cytochrome c-type biogenesis protein CcmH